MGYLKLIDSLFKDRKWKSVIGTIKRDLDKIIELDEETQEIIFFARDKAAENLIALEA